MKKKFLKKRGQEEMIGFVLIVVLVAIIALVFLAISVRRPSGVVESKEIENFLYSSLRYTTSCQPNDYQFYDFKDLIGACSKNKACEDGKDSCDVLEEISLKLIENSFPVEKGSKYKYYNFKIYTENGNLLILEKGDQTAIKNSAEVFIPISGENFYIKMELNY